MKKSAIFMSIFIAFILISSVIGFLYAPENTATPTGTKQYGNIQFSPGQNNQWIALYNNQQLIFDYLPEELSSITLPGTFLLQNPRLYVIFNASESNQGYLIQKLKYNLRTLGKQVGEACLSEADCPDIPIKDCSEPGILLKPTPKNQVKVFESCIVIEGDALYQSQVIDKLAQAMLGV